jgi:hypothetical protein
MRRFTVSVQQWAAKLSHPSVEVLMLGAEVIIQEDGELIAAGSLLPDRRRPTRS